MCMEPSRNMESKSWFSARPTSDYGDNLGTVSLSETPIIWLLAR